MKKALPYLLSVIALALGYAVAGWLGLKMAIPPGYAAPVFPAAGIALAALFIFGKRLWPGVFLGSLAVQLQAAAAVGVNTPLPSVLLLTPSAAALQAVVGAWLVERLIGRDSRFDNAASILRLDRRA
ncbi:MASE1 domain-containing protein, partial [Arthrospira platensis SPKY1]|nr:MASE1 domain-containing protein [Arthrospira platensis SPKY1]